MYIAITISHPDSIGVNMFFPCSAKRRASDKDLPVPSEHGQVDPVQKLDQ